MRRPGAAPVFPHAPSFRQDAAFPARPDSAAGSRAPTGGYGVTVPTARARETGPAARRAAPRVPAPRDGLGGRRAARRPGPGRGGAEPRVSVIVPARNEGDGIVPVLDRLSEAVRLSCEVLVVVDDPADTTAGPARQYARADPRVRCVINSYGRGPANAIRFGIDAAAAPVAVVTMADGCDDPAQIDSLCRLVERGVVVAAASRYMAGGQQVGGPRVKGMLSGLAGRSLRLLAHTGTRDATNSFKAYSTEFVREVGIDSRDGFEIGIELIAKARRLGRPVAEIPTIWLDRQAGVSSFEIARWIPSYLRWYRFAFGPRLSAEQIRGRAAGRSAREQ
jgi:dolichol-phosphate mannosyltransferase